MRHAPIQKSSRHWLRRGLSRAARSRTVRELLAPVVIAVIAIAPLRSAVADWNDVPSSSMRPTILEGDRIGVNKLAYGLRVPFTHTWITRREGPERGEIVTLASPGDGQRLVKRIVGIPGDQIALRDNRIWLNGEPLSYSPLERRATETTPAGVAVAAQIMLEQLPGRAHPVTWIPIAHSRGDFGPIEVPEGHYFFLGDNRDMSRDSRALGLVERDKIYGRVTRVVLSIDRESYRPRWDRWWHRLP